MKRAAITAPLTDPTPTNGSKRRRLSLKWKWALWTSLGVLVIFVGIVLLLFNSFTTVLVRQERTHVDDTLTVVAEKLNVTSAALTPQQVLGALDPQTINPATTSDDNVYANSVITSLARDSLAVTVYAPSGRQLFESRPHAAPFKRSTHRQVGFQQVNQATALVGRTPIHSKQDGRLIGYVQVTDQLADYHQTRSKLAGILVVVGLIAVLISSVFSYILATFLLRPVEAISDTIHAVREDPQSDVRVPETRSNDELADLATLFNGMLDTMQRYIDQQQQFVEDVSHELRTPVAIIQGHMEMLNRWGKDDPEILAESISASLQETKRMQSLVQEMLDLSRAEQVEVTYPNEISNVTEVVTQTFANFQMIHPDFTFILDNDVKRAVEVQIYRNHLEQVLIILLDNAVKYSTTRKEIHLTYERDVRHVEIAVQDFGEGISQENMKRVFNRFYRVDKARSRTKGGNGLGLAIAQRLVEAYHGKITIESALGHGSVFRVSLPILSPGQVAVLTERKQRSQEEGDVPTIQSELLEPLSSAAPQSDTESPSSTSPDNQNADHEL